jgi:N-methylhydantoinase A
LFPIDTAAKARTSTSRIAADVGGTFTDVAVFDEATHALTLGKTLSTPGHLATGISDGVLKADAHFGRASLFLHGTTVAINTMLERTGSRTALVTTRGFRDIYEIGRINRPEAYNLFFRKHQPLIERALRFEVNERLNAAGEELHALDETELAAVAESLTSAGVEAIAILFLHSYRNPAHEIAAKRFFEQHCPGLFVTASHELSQEYREFERTSTVAANAYVGPRVRSYLRELDTYLAAEQFPGQFLIVQSTGGLYDSRQAGRECIRMLESGPAAGVIGTRALCQAIGLTNAIAFDMGGTTAKAGVILEGTVLMAGNAMVGGYAEGLPVQIPMIDIQEVGTGGGSIARLGPGNSLRVGPQSAGAKPGPACYGLGGTEPTVTDANLVLGRLAADRFLGGDMKLDADAARRAVADTLGDLALPTAEAADGIIRIATSAMSHVVKRVTTERGLDARDFVLVAYGGAGPLHAALVARELQIATVIIPNAPGHFSAFGMLVADLRRDFVRTLFCSLADAPFDLLEAAYGEMESEGRQDIERAASPDTEVAIVRGADMRYVGQEHAVYVAFPREMVLARDVAGLKARFDAVHRVHYGYASEDENAEIVSLRCSVSGLMPKPSLPRLQEGGPDPSEAAQTGSRPVYFTQTGRFVDTPTLNRAKLHAGVRLTGPVLVEEYASTTVVPPGDTLTVDAFGNLVITVNA